MWYKRLETISCKRHRVIRVGLLAAILFAVQAAVSIHHAPIALAGGSGPIIHWNSSMIYAGENNGYPWGPVGENASIEGDNYPANQQYRLVLVQGNSNNDATLCKSPVATVGTATSSSTGQFYQNFSWPVAAGQVNKEYSICTILTADGSVASSKDDGPFTVLTSSPPVIDISSTSVAAGGTVTVTGHNWVPPQSVNINIAGCADCEPGNTEVGTVTAHSTGLNDGSFSVVMTIPANTKAANYVVDALTQSGMDANHTTGVKHLAITSAAPIATAATTPTVTATTAATTTPVATVTPTAIPGGNNTGSNNGSDSGSNGLAIGLFAVLGLLVLAIAGVVVFMLMQRSAARRKTSSGASSNYGQTPFGGPISNGGYPMQQGGPISNADYPMQQVGPISNAGYPMQQGSHGQYGQAAGAVPGYNNQAQPSNYPANNYGQTVQQFGSSPGYGQPQLSPTPPEPMQQYGSSPNYGQSMPQQPAQQGWSSPAHNQYMAPNGYNDATVANVALCANCGLPLAPDEPRCSRCGMPVGTHNSSTSNWGR